MSCWDFKSTVKYCSIDDQHPSHGDSWYVSDVILIVQKCNNIHISCFGLFFFFFFSYKWRKKHNTWVKSHKTVNYADGWSLIEECCKCVNERFRAAQFCLHVYSASRYVCLCLCAYSSTCPSPYSPHRTECMWLLRVCMLYFQWLLRLACFCMVSYTK